MKGKSEMPDPKEIFSRLPQEVQDKIDNILGGSLKERAAKWDKPYKSRSMRRADKIL